MYSVKGMKLIIWWSRWDSNPRASRFYRDAFLNLPPKRSQISSIGAPGIRSDYLVEPMGFEPTTFPVLPGRALDGRRQTDQPLYEFPALLALDIAFPPDRLFP